jgi:hypothetical protein
VVFQMAGYLHRVFTMPLNTKRQRLNALDNLGFSKTKMHLSNKFYERILLIFNSNDLTNHALSGDKQPPRFRNGTVRARRMNESGANSSGKSCPQRILPQHILTFNTNY